MHTYVIDEHTFDPKNGSPEKNANYIQNVLLLNIFKLKYTMIGLPFW